MSHKLLKSSYIHKFHNALLSLELSQPFCEVKDDCNIDFKFNTMLFVERKYSLPHTKLSIRSLFQTVHDS